MDEKYINTLRQNIIVALKRAEANILNDHPLDLNLVTEHVQIFQNYLTKHMPDTPSNELKNLVHDVFFDIQRLYEHLANEAHISKIRLSEMTQSQKIARGYTYGGNK